MAETLVAFGDSSRRIFLFDTFEGHPSPDANRDVDLWGEHAIEEWRRRSKDGVHSDWACVSLHEVRDNLGRTGYPPDKLIFVKGMVEETACRMGTLEQIALLRLDTDWYESTRAGLENFYPRLVRGGVLILDDYGHYKGQREAVDEYFETMREHILLNRIDYSCRLGIRC